ncbi:MAG TPA: dockerin type I repeat-containing protein, partial [candidate division Zixibacteria bacterium]|nr:dockerin type I repeat-containing protein [candidate division Zixibacteria bacterium]
DVDGNGTVDVADIIYLADYMFGDPAGPAPTILAAADVDGSGTFDISDLIYLVDYSFGEPAGPDPICTGSVLFSK